MDWLNLLIGAVIGWAMPYIITGMRNASRVLYLWGAKQMKGRVRVDIIKKVLSLHNPKDGLTLYNDVFVKKCNRGELCLLTKDEWMINQVISPFEKCIVKMADEKNLMDEQADETVGVKGSKIFNGNICVVRGVPHGIKGEWTLESCDYYSYAHFRRKVLFSKYIPNFLLRGEVGAWLKNPLNVILDKSEAIAVGASVALVHDIEHGEKEILLHVRSKDVFVEPSMLSVLPCFGVESNRRMGYESVFGVLQYNFIRELGEELFGIPEIVCANDKYHPDWFVKHESISKVIEDWKAERFRLHLIGICIDPWNPSVHFSFAACSKELRFWNKYYKDGSLSWEVAHNRQGNPIVCFFKLSEQLLEQSEGNPMTGTTRFLISRLLNIMKGESKR